MAKQKRDLVDEYTDYEEAREFEEKRRRYARPKKDSANLVPGIVMRARGHHFDVQIGQLGASGDHEAETSPSVWLCEVRGRLRQEKTRDTLVAVGDQVWVLPRGKLKGLIERVEERESVLSRQHPGVEMPAEDVILANLDQVLIVFATAQPEPHLRMLDRFLVIAEANELPTYICANKVDLAGIGVARDLFGLYEQVGYTVIYTSAETGEGIDELRTLLSDALTVITGPSGVGKSSLLNALHPSLNLQVGELREVIDKGKHTTRTAQLFHLPIGQETFVADTPGIRELGLYEIDPADLGFYYKDLEPFVNACRYPNCTHDHEPGCAVRAAFEDGKIHPERYDSYIRLLHGEE